MKVLVVDDNPINRKLLRVTLTPAGHETAEAADGIEALEKLRKEPFDAVISDVLMPGMDGYRLCYEIRRDDALKHMPLIIYTSTYTSPSDEKLALSVGADHYLRKPAPAEELLRALGEVTAGTFRPERAAPPLDEVMVLKEYSVALVRKLEDKNVELESAMRVLSDALKDLSRLESEARDIVNFAPIGICDVERHGRIVSANIALARMLGYDAAAELIDRDIARAVYFDASDRPGTLERFESGERRLETRFKKKDGTPLWVEIDGRVVRDEAGSVIRYEDFVHDINARKVAEAQAELSSRQSIRRRHRTLRNDVTAMLVIGVATFFVAGQFSLFRHATEWVMHHEAGPAGVDELIVTLIALSAAGLVFSARRWKELRSEVRERERTERALQFLRGDLENRVAARTSELKEINTELSNEVDERRRSDEALRESETRYREIFDASPLPMWLYDLEELKIAAVNQAAIEQYGFSRAEFLSMTLLDVRTPEEGERLREFLRTTSNLPDRMHAGIWKHRKKDGTIIDVDVYSHAVMIEGKRMRLGLQRDVTDQIRLEEQFRHAQKMEAVGRLAGGIAHDFNNLLMVIGGTGELLELHAGNAEAMERDIRELKQATARGASLTQQLLAFSRKQVVRPVVFDPGEALREMESILGRLLGEDIELACSTAPGSAHVTMDHGQFDQVIMNLAINARDAMPSGGRLSIDVETVERDASYAAAHAESRPGRFVRITIQDSGMGMDASVQSHIFEPFFTTKESGKGTGLGLATVYGIVKGAGGDIWVYSEPGHGTTFKIYLPLADASNTATAVSPNKKTDVVHSGNATILLLEDEETIRKMTEEYLMANGYRVISAGNGNDLLRLAADEPSRIDLLVTDVVVPGKNGREVADELHRKNPSLRVIFMSGYTDDAGIVRGVMSDGVEFLQKPFGLGSLVDKIREMLDR